MDTLTIKCNNVPRATLSWCELSDSERKDFDYLDTEDRQQEATFFRYRGSVYDLSEFMRIEKGIAPHCQRPGWEKFHGYMSDSFFSGVLVKQIDGGDYTSVIVARYYG